MLIHTANRNENCIHMYIALVGVVQRPITLSQRDGHPVWSQLIAAEIFQAKISGSPCSPIISWSLYMSLLLSCLLQGLRTHALSPPKQDVRWDVARVCAVRVRRRITIITNLSLSLSLSLSISICLYVYIYIYIHTHTYICIYIYICIHTYVTPTHVHTSSYDTLYPNFPSRSPDKQDFWSQDYRRPQRTFPSRNNMLYYSMI